MRHLLLGLLAALTIPVSASALTATEPGTVFRDCPDCPAMVVIPPGSFQMGSEYSEAAIAGDPGNREMQDRYEGPVHAVTIARPFALGETEVTVSQFARFVAETGHETLPACRYASAEAGLLGPVEGFSWREAAPGRPAMPDQPVGCVSWRDAKAYIAWLSQKTGETYRLPSEAEWEYAARAGRPETAYAWGDDPDAACSHGNIRDRYGSGGIPARMETGADCFDGWAEVAPVKRFQPNPFGLYDMTGNVWEWAEDCYRMPYPEDTPTDGSAYQVAGECDRRVTKGGSWITSITRQRPTFRGRDPEDQTTWIFGFRLARSLAE